MTGYTPGYKAHYKCDYGYKLIGEAYRECLYSGYWGGEEPVCERKSVKKKIFKSRLRNIGLTWCVFLPPTQASGALASMTQPTARSMSLATLPDTRLTTNVIMGTS